MSNELENWKRRYIASGLATIPLAQGSKRPLIEAWQLVAPYLQWQDITLANVGILAGNGIAIIDCDSLETTQVVSARLAGMGIDAPTVKTPSKGHHKYILIRDAPREFNWSKLAVGAGELRVRNAYVVAPSSTFEGKDYVWLDSAPEDIARLKPVAWRDLQWLLASAAQTKAQIVDTPPVRLLRQDMPQRANLLLHALQNAPNGVPIDRYGSTSEAEAAVMAILILAGWSLPEIRDLFYDAKPAHFRTYRTDKAKDRYLLHVYNRVLNWVSDTPERTQIAEWYRMAYFGQWKGRHGALDRSVYLGLLASAWRFSTYTPMPGQRFLAEYARTSQSIVSKSLKRLVYRELIQKVNTGLAVACYSLNISDPDLYSRSIDSIPTVTIDTRNVHVVPNSDQLELFSDSRTGLGRSCGLLYECLGVVPITITQLAERTGKHRNTVSSALHRLESYGLARQNSKGRWTRGTGDLAKIAQEFGTERRAEERRRKHDEERLAYREFKATRRDMTIVVVMEYGIAVRMARWYYESVYLPEIGGF